MGLTLMRSGSCTIFTDLGTCVRLLAAQAGDPAVLAGQSSRASGSILRMSQQALRSSMLWYIASSPFLRTK